MKISVIIPCYNCALFIELLVEDLLRSLAKYELTLILVDDGSKDHTPAVLEDLAKAHKNIRLYPSPVNKGQQVTLLHGLIMVTEPCDFVVTMDDDLQHPVETLKKMILKIQEGYDLVYGIPIHESHQTQGQQGNATPSFFRRIGSRFRDGLFNSFLHKPKDIQVSAFRIFTYDLARKLAASRKKYFYLSAEAFQYSIRVANVSYPYRPRHSGQSSYTTKRLLLLYWRLLVSYRLGK